MSTTMTPPPVPTPAEAPLPPPVPRGSSKVVAILTIALGALIVVGTLISSVLSTVAAASTTTGSRSADVAGVDTLVAELSAGSLRIEFADVTEAELEVRSAFGADQWTLERRDDDLVVRSPDWRFGWFWPLRGNGEAVLRLPESMAAADADLQMSAGDLSVAGSFGDVDLTVGAGQARVEGTVGSLDLELNAGEADVDVENAREADFTVNAGSLDAALSGRQPDDIAMQVNAGSVTVSVPGGEYDVTSQVSAGDFDNRIGSTPGASSTVDVQVSAGSVTLRAFDRSGR